MSKECLLKTEKQDNNGSVMITVIIFFMFISILIAILMPLTVMNYRMKVVERHAKDEFYYVEKSLNDIYSGVGKECAKELGKAYNDTLANSYSFTDEDLAYNEFCNKYVDKLVKAFFKTGDYASGPRINVKTKMNGYITDEAKNHAIVNNIVDDTDADTYINVYFVNKDGTVITNPISQDYKDYKKMVIEDVIVSSVDGSEYSSSIKTNIEVRIPELSFFRVNENELDYALVACKGIYFNGSAEITGNVYGGVGKDSSKTITYGKGGINVSKIGETPDVILKGNYIVSGGDITVNGGNLVIGNSSIANNDNEIWTENIVVGAKKELDDKPSNITVEGNTYALNDLQVEGAYKNVTLKGNYYGYGSGDTSINIKSNESIFKKAEPDSYYDDISRSMSSSIAVNATEESSVDLSGLKNLVLLGQTYIDHNSKIDDGIQVDKNTTRIGKDGTGIAGAMKASQEILLVPEEFLKTSNPVQVTGGNPADIFGVKETELTSWINHYFGSDNVKLKDGAPTKIVLVNGVNNYAYCYLQFKDGPLGDEAKYRNAYIDKILNCDMNAAPAPTTTPVPGPTLQTMKSRIIYAIGAQDCEIVTNGIQNVYAKNGGVISFTYNRAGESKERLSMMKHNQLKLVNDASDNAGYSSTTNLVKKYKDLTTYANFNSDFTKTIADGDYNEPDYPFGRLWWKQGIDDDTSSENPIVTYLGDCIMVVHGNGELNLGDTLSAALSAAPAEGTYEDNGAVRAIVISDGDVVVNSNVNMKGFIFCNGKLTVEENKKLTIASDLSVVQKRISQEVVEVKKSIPADLSKEDDQFEKIIESKYVKGYLIRYFLSTSFNTSTNKIDKKYTSHSTTGIVGKRRYNITTNNTSESSLNVNSDYTSFVSFENWRKTGALGH